MKTLTALVMTGALALGACGPDVYRNTNGSVTYLDHVRRDGWWYEVRVTDQHRRAIAGVRERAVTMTGWGLTEHATTPYCVEGTGTLPQNGEPVQFGHGSIKYSYTTPSGEAVGCAWGTDLSPMPGYEQCTAKEVGAASAMLNVAAEDIFD